ncbi:MAG: hypothetical protein EB023_06485 [Flavobacteriia bacterium]|nr:hypothetical protein [Flavobacteriia bacterium]
MVFVIAPQLRRVGLCIGQNQMCHLRTGLLLFFGVRELCLCGWLKITRLFNLSFRGARESLRLFELKKCAVEKIKNTEGSAMSVGSVAVQLKYGLYVGHLSKLAFHFMFIVVRLVVVVSSVRLACKLFIHAINLRLCNQIGCIVAGLLRMNEFTIFLFYRLFCFSSRNSHKAQHCVFL